MPNRFPLHVRAFRILLLTLPAIPLWGAAAIPAIAEEPAANPKTTATATPKPTPLTIVERSIAQDQGGWQLDYRLRHQGVTGIVVTPTEILARVEGWVSNSRISGHAVPKLSTLVVSGPSGLTGSSDVINTTDESQRCRERAVLQVWTGDDPGGPPDPIAKAVVRPVAVERQPILSIAPGGIVRVRLRLEHQHIIFGDYDPLLGQRAVELQIGSAILNDVVPMDREQYLAQPKSTWPAPPHDRRDTPRHSDSGPESLHLEAHVVGNQYYRFPERPVRYGTKMRLRFWYLIASGTENECCARVLQYKDTPICFNHLNDGTQEHTLTTVGRWVKVERVFRTESEATKLALEFKICSEGVSVGEMWIDDVTLEPVAAGPSGP